MIANALLQIVITYLVFGALLFGGAGTLHWPAAWRFLAAMVMVSLVGTFWLIRRDPELVRERLRPPLQKEQGTADRIFVGALLLTMLAWLAVIGLDMRFDWSPPLPLWARELGLLLWLGGLWLGFRVLAENSFAAPVVKIQAERRQHVIASGPYGYVRHPMYTGAMLFFFGVPLLLDSWWGLAGAVVMTLLFCARTFIEEEALVKGLPGYVQYREAVRYRLVPYLW